MPPRIIRPEKYSRDPITCKDISWTLDRATNKNNVINVIGSRLGSVATAALS